MSGDQSTPASREAHRAATSTIAAAEAPASRHQDGTGIMMPERHHGTVGSMPRDPSVPLLDDGSAGSGTHGIHKASARAQLVALLHKQAIVYRRSPQVPLCSVLAVPAAMLFLALLVTWTGSGGEAAGAATGFTPLDMGTGRSLSPTHASAMLRYAPSALAAGDTDPDPLDDGAVADSIMAAAVAASDGVLSLDAATGNVRGYAQAEHLSGAVWGGISAAYSPDDDVANGPTWAAVLFRFTPSANASVSQAVDVSYTVGYNGTKDYAGSWFAFSSLVEKQYGPGTQESADQVGLQLALDAAIASTVVGPTAQAPARFLGTDGVADTADVSSSFSMTLAAFRDVLPPTSGVGEWSVTSWAGSCLLVLALTWTTLAIMKLVADEKSKGLVASMRFMGLNEGVYWVSWHLPLQLVSLATALIAPAVASLAGIAAFTNYSYVLWVMILWPAMAANCAFGLTFTAAVSSRAGAAAMSVLVFLVCACIQGSFAGISAAEGRPASAFGPSAWDRMYDRQSVPLTMIVVINVLPVFHIGKAFDDVLKYAGPQPSGDASDTSQTAWDAYWSQNVFALNGRDLTGPSTGATVAILWSLYFMYSLAAWHRGRPKLGVNTGCKARVQHELCCCLSARRLAALNKGRKRAPSTSRQRSASSLGGIGDVDSEDSDTDVPVAAGAAAAAGANRTDRVSTAQRESAATGSIRLVKMTKAYDSGTAVKELSITMNPGEVFALLGHNGAGKSTTINCITGQTAPTYGDAFVRGLDVRSDMIQIQRMQGVCPQHDVLFDELSGAQHFEFWGRFKGVPAHALQRTVQALLREVQLEAKAHAPVGSYSGGMRRRVSLGNAVIGDQPVLFLDEPTTGMDVVVRRVVWDLVARRKEEGAVVVVTTHSMEEADALADNIAIMAEGRLRAIGSSLFLKSRYGAGFNISVSCKKKDHAEVDALIRRLLPGADVVTPVAGSFNVGLPRRSMRALPEFFRECEAGSTGVTEWGISNTTLESVFIRLTTNSTAVNATLAGLGDDANRLCVLCNKRPTELCTLKTRTGKEVQTPDLVCALCADGVDASGMGAAIEGEATAPGADEAKDGSGIEVATIAVAAGGVPTPTEGGAATTAASVAAGGEGDSGDAATSGRLPAMSRGSSSVSVAARAQESSTPLRLVVSALMAKQSATFAGPCFNRHARRAFNRMNQAEQRNVPLAPGIPLMVCVLMVIAAMATVVGVFLAQAHATNPWPPGGVPDFSDLSGGDKGRAFRDIAKGFTETCTDGAGAQTVKWYSKLGAPYQMCSSRVYGALVERQLSNCSADGAGGAVSTDVTPFDCFEVSSLAAARVVNPARPTTVWVGTSPLSPVTLPWASSTGGGHVATFVATPGDDPVRAFNASAEYFEGNRGPVGTLACLFPDASVGDGKPLPPSWDEWTDNDWSVLADSPEAARQLFDSLVPDIGITVMDATAAADRLTLDVAVAGYVAADASIDPKGDQEQASHPAPAAPQYKLLNAFFSANSSANSGLSPLVPMPPDGLDVCSRVNVEVMTGLRAQLAVARASVRAFLASAASQGHAASGGSLASIESTWFRLPSPDFTWFAREDGSSKFAVGLTMAVCVSAVVHVAGAPFLAHAIVSERNSGTLRMMQMQGVTTHAYALAEIGYFAWLSVRCVLVVLIAPVIELAVMAPWSPSVAAVVVMSVLASVSATGYGALVARACDTERSTAFSMLTYLAVATGLSFLSMVRLPGLVLVVLPPAAFARLLYVASVGDDDGDLSALIVLCAVHNVLLLAAAYISLTELPSPLKPVARALARVLCCGGATGGPDAGSGGSTPAMATSSAVDDADDDVAVERDAVDREPARERKSHAIAIDGLRKTFPARNGQPPVDAVRGISMRVDYGEVFGLLGPNGSGKTTLISCLTGVEGITAGAGMISGSDCVEELQAVRRAIGVVPQFDALWPNLTIRQHLEVFARLAGLVGDDVTNAVMRIAEQLELDGDKFDCPASFLSGGMRRRVSIGCAIIGNSKVLFLDEIWNVVRALRSDDRAVVLTTHAMDEAEALCSRIGIIVDGQLRCLGTPLHLKRKYADAYRLTINVNTAATTAAGTSASAGRRAVTSANAGMAAGDLARAEAFIHDSVAPRAEPVRSFGRSRRFDLPPDTQVSEVFDAMRGGSARAGISEWSISAASLEQVFVQVVRRAKGEL